MTEPQETEIVFVNSFPGPGLGGGEIQLLSVIEACTEAGIRVTVICALGSGLVTALAGREVRTVAMDFTLPGLVVTMFRLRALLNGHRGADRQAPARGPILQGTGFLTNLITRIAAWGLGAVQVVNAVHVEPGASLFDGGSRAGFKLRAGLERMTGRRVDRYIAVSDAVARAMVEKLHIDGERIVVVRNGVDPIAVREQSKHSLPGPEAGPPWDADEASPWIGFVGRLEAVKGVELFLRAVHFLGASAHLRNRETVAFADRPAVPTFVVAGTGGLEEPLTRVAAELGLTREPGTTPEMPYRVHFLGHVHPVAPLYRRLRALVIPSFSEGLPMAALEAMALGVPVVASRVGGIPEVVEDGVTGWLFPAGDLEEAAFAIQNAVANAGEARERGERGSLRVEEQFTLARMKQEYLAVYAALTSGRRSTSSELRSD